MPREKVKPIVGDAFETGWEHITQEEVIMREDLHLVLILSEVLDEIGRPRVVLEVRHYELFKKTIRGDFLQER